MNIGLMAHDAKKELMQNFCIAYKRILSGHSLYATGNTGRMIEDVSNLPIHKFLPGQLGGDRQMGTQIECNEIDAMFFFRDPGDSGHEDNNYLNINRLCDRNNIPIATNIATAEILILAIDRGDLSWRDLYK